MNFYELELKDRVIKLRLTSGKALEIEKKTGIKLLDYIQDYSMTTIITLLRYLMMYDKPNVSIEDASNVYDELIDSGRTIKEILYDVIYEGLVVSGFLTKGELDEMKNLVKEAHEKKKQEVLQK